MSKKRSSARRVQPPEQPPEPQPPQIPPPDHPLECVPPPKAEPDPERHSRKCLICHHPDRAALESDYIHWVSPDYISSAYNLWDRQTIYRHARATGLNELRRQNLRCVIEPILEYTHYLRPTACDILNAARAYSRINDYGQWVDPPKEVVISKRPYFQEGVNAALRKEIFDLMQDRKERQAAGESPDPKPPTPNPKLLIDTIPKLESHPTPTKQSPKPISNRYKPSRTRFRAAKRRVKNNGRIQ